MLSLLNLYRFKASAFIRQFYMPGMRGAAAILVMHLVILLTVRLAARRMARLSAQNARQLAKPARRLAYVPDTR